MGEKGNVAAGSAGIADHVAAGVESVGASASDVARTVTVGVATTIATEEAQKRRAKGSDDKDDEGGTETSGEREL